MQEIQLQLTLAEVNHILEALGERPYRQVYQLIVKIQGQAEAQIDQSRDQRPSLPPEPGRE